MKSLFIFTAALAYAAAAYGQEPALKFSGYLESYYGYDFSHPADHNRPSFVYSHNRDQEVNINLAMLRAAYAAGNIRAGLALMAGTYANANLAAEPGVLKNIYEASAGVRLSPKADLWLDAGIFSSHIGFESAVSRDCWVLTRNISSENTPYYETGAKISYMTPNHKIGLTVLYLNGWQRISRQNGNSRPAGGLQLSWKPAAGLTLNYSNYLGTEGADSICTTRFYHNLYAVLQLSPKAGLTAGFDYGTQQKEKGKPGTNQVWSPVLIARYALTGKWALAARAEYYSDRHRMLVSMPADQAFETAGFSLNADYAPAENALIRLEGKTYHSRNAVFSRDNLPSANNSLITASFALSF